MTYGPNPRSQIDRLMDRIQQEPGSMDDPCWVPALSRTNRGYTRMTTNGSEKRAYSHRLTYEHFVGPIPDGFQLDHLCRNRACCNPTHLEPVTPRENFLRGNHRCAVVFRTGVCTNGHSMDDAYVNPFGQRQCRTCRAENMRTFRAKFVESTMGGAA